LLGGLDTVTSHERRRRSRLDGALQMQMKFRLREGID